MKRLGETYDRASGSNGGSGQQSTQTTRLDEWGPLPSRESICLGDVIAVLFGTAVVCLGVILRLSPTIVPFDGNIIGIQRLAELTTSLGISAIVVWMLLLYSLVLGTRSEEKHSRLHLAAPIRSSSKYPNSEQLLHLIVRLFSEPERNRL